MRVGIVSPYSFDVPGGVQNHVRDLAEYLIGQRHYVDVLAPADDDTPLPRYVTSAGRAVPVPYNGSVARLLFGPVTAARVARWIERGRFDVVHVHEPISPSLSMLAMWAVEGPLVATFHTSGARSRALLASRNVLQPGLEKISGRIAVSQEARRFVQQHIGGDAIVIPNGVYVGSFAAATPRPEWQGSATGPTLAFLGRIEEPRKGLAVLLEAMPALLRQFPGLRLLVAGPGDPSAVLAGHPDAVRRACTFLGAVSDEDRAKLLCSADLYIAPNTGGESFGIILVEAMSAHAAVVASDLVAFRAVLDDGWAGAMFANEDPRDLTQVVADLLTHDTDRRELAARGFQRAQRYDWSRVGAEIVDVYATVMEAFSAGAAVVGGPQPRPIRWWRGGS